MSEIPELAISSIIMGERRREDYGDIKGLADSIEQWGLLHPIVVDESNNLVAGGRRLEACRSLLWTSIPVRRLGDLTEAEIHEIELEENLRRKDLTQYEKSKTMVRLAEVAREIAAEETEPEGAVQSEDHATVIPFRSTVERNPQGGRPSEHGSYRDVEERTGIPAPTLKRAEQHVAAVDRYPEVKDYPQRDAITVAKNLDQLPEPVREEKREALRQFDQDTLAQLAEKPPMPKAERPAKPPAMRWNEAMHDLWVLLNSARSQGGIAAITEHWDTKQKAGYLAEIKRIQEILGEWDAELTRSIQA